MVDDFIRSNRRKLLSGPAAIVAVLELGAAPGSDLDEGRPIHVQHAVHYQASTVPDGTEWLGGPEVSEQGYRSDLALLVLARVLDDGRPFVPDRACVSFSLPEPDDWTAIFGYPRLRGSMGTTADGDNLLDLDRTLVRASGHVTAVFEDGPPDQPNVNGPSFSADLPMPWGMSGGPVIAGRHLCGVASRALDPDPTKLNKQWTSYALGLAPTLELTVYDGPPEGRFTLRELIDNNSVDVIGEIPPAPLHDHPIERFTFSLPATD